ncbi:MAG: BamA/TamA family outer membrane protein [bacterium]|nr:BamA/TamA family outer membrane protein [bacterium]
MKKLFILLLLATVAFPSHALEEKKTAPLKTDNAEKKINKKEKKRRIIVSPIAFYSPETRFAFGAVGSLIFRDKTGKGRPSSISPLLIYTAEKQFIAQLNTDLYLKEGGYRIKGEIKFLKYPDKFYGLGGGTPATAEELFTTRSANFSLLALKRITPGFNLGLRYHFNSWKVVEFEAGRQLDSAVVPGASSGTISGLYLAASRDTRDNIYFPMKGEFFEFEAGIYNKIIGSEFNFGSINVNLRKYFTVFSSHVFALQAVARVRSGTVPLGNFAKLGGPFLMRGYYEGRFQDKNLTAFQAEYRLPLFWRIGAVAFAGLGNVSDTFAGTKNLTPSYGVGLRFLFDKKEKIWIRMDLGFGQDGNSGIYFSIFEAF